jgi:hypothetical protein
MGMEICWKKIGGKSQEVMSPNQSQLHSNRLQQFLLNVSKKTIFVCLLFFDDFLVVVRISTCSLKFSILPGMMICQPFMTQFRKRTSHILTRPPAMTG